VGEAELARAWAIFRQSVARVELLADYEGDAFVSSGRLAHDLLAIAAVHPLRDTAVRQMLERAGEDWAIVRGLLESGELVEVRWEKERYLLRPVARRGWRGRN